MSRYLIATMPIPGHYLPMLPIARELLQRGHEVVWYGSKFFKERIEATGARFVPITSAIDFGDNDYDRHFPGRAQKKGINQLIFDLIHVFIHPVEGMYRDLKAILRDFPADALVADIGMAAATLMAVQNEIPVASLSISALGYPDPDLPPDGLGLLPDPSLLGKVRDRLMKVVAARMVFAPVQKELDILTDRMGVPRYKFGITGSPHLLLQPSIPEFEYKRRSLPPQIHYIGALLPQAPQTDALPAWWAEVVNTGQPIVLVTQGTIATDSEQLIAPTLEALAGEPVQVVATTGGKTAAELGLNVPANAHVEPFIPFRAIMPHISAYVTNGGFGGVMIALSHGVPMVAGGKTEDKPEVTNRIQYTGVGINLKTATPTPEQVRNAVKKVLGDPTYRQKAQMLQRLLVGYDAPCLAADLIERLAATRQPVLR